MTKFRTEVELPEFKKKIGYRHRSMMIGSCFAENIGTYLQDLCLPVMVNPSGILFNPVSIANNLEELIAGKKFGARDLFFSNGLYNSFSHHSRFSGTNSVTTLRLINTRATEASDFLKNCSHLFITFGTSLVFKHKISGKVVSNCHKLPSATFDRYRLTVEQITEVWIPLINQLKEINPDLNLVFTVSPIRHLTDGAHENQLSKSTLLMAIEALISYYGNAFITYFASYELVQDELRDYRFYAADMVHLSEVAIDFIRGKFIAAFMDQEAKTVLSELENILQSLNHIPFNNKEIRYLSFIKNQIEKTNQLQNKYPFADFKSVIKKLHEKIAD